MHGAYDLSLTRSSEGKDSGQAGNVGKLPKSLRYPDDSYRVSNPWSRSLLNGDFILIAEFAENEGPKPVMTIPKNGAGNFDINAFTVHVMSVDYQAQSRGSNFSMVEDTQLFLTEMKDNVYAYVHHLTLYDIHARGFVRPYCMCYISHCKRKMLSFLDHLMDEFTKVSRLFRHGNRISFSRDLEQRLTDVFAMREEKTMLSVDGHFVRKNWKDIETSKKKQNEEIDYILKETRKLIAVLKPHMNDPRIAEQFRRLESMAEGRNRSHTDHSLRVNQRESDHKLSSSSKQPVSLRRVVSLPNLKDLVQGKKEAKSGHFLPSYFQGIKQLRHLHELCEWGAKEGINRLRNILKHFSRETAALMIEEMDARHLERLPSLLTIGRSVVSNVLQKVDMNCMRHQWGGSSHSNPLYEGCPTRKSSCGSLGSLYSLESFQSCLDDDTIGSARSSDGILSPFTPSSCFHADLHGVERLDISRESYAGSVSESSDVMSTHSDTTLTATSDELCFSDYALLDEELALSDSRPSFSRQTSAMLERGSFTNFSIQSSRKSLSLDSLASLPSDQRNYKRRARTGPLRGVQGNIPQMAHSGSDRVPTISVLEADARPSCTGGTSRTHSVGRVELLKRAKSEGGSGTSSPVGENKLFQRKLHYFLRPERIRLRCFAEEVCQPVETYSGSNVLLLRNNWSCGVHLVFALLCGRPVVVLADPCNERDVRILISALWMFVPENTSLGKVAVPWRSKPLQIADLAWLKLVGLAKNKHCNVLPKSVKRFVSVLDYETGLIATPPYKGYYLRSVCNFSNRWPTNAALVAFIHSVFLELANKSYVYYYAYCLGGLQWCCCKSQRSACGPVIEVHGDGAEILTKLGVHFSDVKIVQYLTEVIKQQQIDYQQNLTADQDLIGEGALTPESDSAVERRSPLIVTDLSKCALFRNVKPLEF